MKQREGRYSADQIRGRFLWRQSAVGSDLLRERETHMRRASYLSQAQIASNRSSASPTLRLWDASGCPVKRMFIKSRLDFFLFATLLCAPQVTARQYHAPSLAGEGKIHLDVVVTPKSGPP
jgi:hypothetical protein